MTAPILIRADASPAMGAGHVMRCLALAEALVELGRPCRFLAAGLPEALRARLERAGFGVQMLAAEPGGPADRDATLELARGAAALVLDGYHFGADYRAALAASGRPVLAFDDLCTLPSLHASMVVNPSPAALSMPYAAAAPGADLLLGPAYAPLRREFRDALAIPLPPLADRRSLLLTFGGSDPPGLTVPVVKRLAPDLPDGMTLEVVIGGANPRRACVEAAVARFPDRARLHVETERMGELMRCCGLAVAAAGGTLGELAALRVPTLLVPIADNQRPSAAAAAAAGAVVMVDGCAENAAGAVVATALSLWQDPARRAALADRMAVGGVDGQGAVRIAAALAARLAR
ncbi:MAG TPA: UDP-2,4-diacetamido-2,4,6-trideoxy-beta-L-altropyranose hydrolase [Azospirillaceae bacterium]|nr:UDP-2,4-diacetamido-2,4,6-trideoxy-beta-L-altropyranose hydrolase [Azospirillaceae bacterium]